MGCTGPHFSESELQCRGTTCGPSGTGCHVNGCVQRFVDALEAFRAEAANVWAATFARPLAEFPGVHVNSAYRCAQHNAQAGGAGKSEHMLGLAADVSVDGMTAAELEVIARKILAIRGIGRSDRKSYIHIDVRQTLTLARWCYNAEDVWCLYYPPKEQVA